MGSITRYRSNFNIRLMQSFQVFTFFTTTDYNHRIVVAS